MKKNSNEDFQLDTNSAEFKEAWAHILAKSWLDPDFKKKFSDDPHGVFKAHGLDIPKDYPIHIDDMGQHDPATGSSQVESGAYGGQVHAMGCFCASGASGASQTSNCHSSAEVHIHSMGCFCASGASGASTNTAMGCFCASGASLQTSQVKGCFCASGASLATHTNVAMGCFCASGASGASQPHTHSSAPTPIPPGCFCASGASGASQTSHCHSAAPMVMAKGCICASGASHGPQHNVAMGCFCASGASGASQTSQCHSAAPMVMARGCFCASGASGASRKCQGSTSNAPQAMGCFCASGASLHDAPSAESGKDGLKLTVPGKPGSL